MPVKGSAPCPTMPGPPRSRLRQAPFGLTVAPLQESLEDFLTPVAPGKHRPLAPPSAGSGPAPAPNEAPPAAPPAAASLPPGSRPVPGSSPGASLVRAPPLVSSAAGPWLPVPGERARCCPQGGEKPRLDQLYRERRLRQRLLRDPTHRRRPAKRRGRVGLDGGGRQAAGGEPSLAGGHQASVPGSHLGVGAAAQGRPCAPGAGAAVDGVEPWLPRRRAAPGLVRAARRLRTGHGASGALSGALVLPGRAGIPGGPVAWGLLGQVLEAVQHRTSRSVLRRDIKAENVLVDLATGEAELIDFGCGTILQDAFHARMSGTLEYSPLEWILFGCYCGQPATIWSLGILLYDLVCEHLPFHSDEGIIWGQLFFLL
ncbi:translation initiation factor IF-2-like isoform X2 [Motacilla alba alba]|uniref:translation initiation factor IF-2-like isoform X2 n=1 Tax=Motacilla alba alba TaxID=1094192 RepID=UPI0018D4E43E|nr:translation initiation factor IF-2-like isoform X2 [Motacilla alba alba]